MLRTHDILHKQVCGSKCGEITPAGHFPKLHIRPRKAVAPSFRDGAFRTTMIADHLLELGSGEATLAGHIPKLDTKPKQLVAPSSQDALFGTTALVANSLKLDSRRKPVCGSKFGEATPAGHFPKMYIRPRKTVTPSYHDGAHQMAAVVDHLRELDVGPSQVCGSNSGEASISVKSDTRAEQATPPSSETTGTSVDNLSKVDHRRKLVHGAKFGEATPAGHLPKLWIRLRKAVAPSSQYDSLGTTTVVDAFSKLDTWQKQVRGPKFAEATPIGHLPKLYIRPRRAL